MDQVSEDDAIGSDLDGGPEIRRRSDHGDTSAQTQADLRPGHPGCDEVGDGEDQAKPDGHPTPDERTAGAIGLHGVIVSQRRPTAVIDHALPRPRDTPRPAATRAVWPQGRRPAARADVGSPREPGP